MTSTIIRHEIDPIVIVHISGELKSDDHFQSALKAAALFEGIVGKVYLVLDLTGAHIEMTEMLDIAGQMTKGWSGTASDPRVITLMAVCAPNSALVAQHLIYSWEGWRRVFIYPNLAQALASARGPILYENLETITPARFRKSIV